MKYLALDQALQTSGWAVFNNSSLEKIGTFKTPGTAPIEKRLGEIFSHLTKLHNEYEFDYVFFEDIQNQGNAETYKKLAYTQATIMLWCYFQEIPFTILSPSHWRKVLKEEYKISFGRKREEQKRAAQEWVKKNFKDFQDVTQDEADAVCIGSAGLVKLRKNKSAF